MEKQALEQESQEVLECLILVQHEAEAAVARQVLAEEAMAAAWESMNRSNTRMEAWGRNGASKCLAS